MIKIVRLEKFKIDFDCNKETPFFQSSSENRLRFILDKLNNDILKDFVYKIYNNDEIEMLFVSEYISDKGKRIRSKSQIGKVIKINNWSELVSFDKETNEGIVYANVKRLKYSDVYNYCSAVKRGLKGAYIVFFSDKYLMYVSSDVIDIISTENNINHLKKDYNEQYDKFYEENQ